MLINLNKLFIKIKQQLLWFYYILITVMKHNFVKKQSERDLIKDILDLSVKMDSPNEINLLFKNYCYLDKPEDIKLALNSLHCFEKVYEYQFTYNKSGLVTSEEKLWKTHRKLLNPSFNLKILQSFIKIFNAKVSILIEKLSKVENDVTFDIGPYFNQLSLDMICSTSFGLDFDIQNGNNMGYLQAIQVIPKLFLTRFLNIWLHSELVFKLTKIYRQQLHYLHRVYKMSSTVIAIKTDEYNNINYDETDDDMSNKSEILIMNLLRLKKAETFTNENVQEHIDTIIAAGTETTASALSNTILLLAMHPDIQESVYEELKMVFSNKNTESNVNFNDINQLPYLEMVIKESLRLFPPIAIFPRKNTADISLDGDFIIRKGSNVYFFLYNLHRRKNIWGPNADTFNPNNFLPENIAKRHPYSFLPFGGGPRNCIGFRYSMIAMKITLSHLLFNYKFFTKQNLEDIVIKFNFILTLKTKHFIQIEKRNGNTTVVT